MEEVFGFAVPGKAKSEEAYLMVKYFNENN